MDGCQMPSVRCRIPDGACPMPEGYHGGCVERLVGSCNPLFGGALLDQGSRGYGASGNRCRNRDLMQARKCWSAIPVARVGSIVYDVAPPEMPPGEAAVAMVVGELATRRQYAKSSS